MKKKTLLLCMSVCMIFISGCGSTPSVEEKKADGTDRYQTEITTDQTTGETTTITKDAENYKELSISGLWISKEGDAVASIDENRYLFSLISYYGSMETDNLKKDYEHLIIGDSQITYQINENNLKLIMDDKDITFLRAEEENFDTAKAKISKAVAKGIMLSSSAGESVDAATEKNPLIGHWLSEDEGIDLDIREDGTVHCITAESEYDAAYLADEDDFEILEHESFLYLFREEKLILFNKADNKKIVFTAKIS